MMARIYRDFVRDPDDVKMIANLRYQESRYMDFLEYLFTFEIRHMTHSEAFEQFEKWEEEQDNQNPQPNESN